MVTKIFAVLTFSELVIKQEPVIIYVGKANANKIEYATASSLKIANANVLFGEAQGKSRQLPTELPGRCR